MQTTKLSSRDHQELRELSKFTHFCLLCGVALLAFGCIAAFAWRSDWGHRQLVEFAGGDQVAAVQWFDRWFGGWALVVCINALGAGALFGAAFVFHGIGVSVRTACRQADFAAGGFDLQESHWSEVRRRWQRLIEGASCVVVRATTARERWRCGARQEVDVGGPQSVVAIVDSHMRVVQEEVRKAVDEAGAAHCYPDGPAPNVPGVADAERCWRDFVRRTLDQERARELADHIELANGERAEPGDLLRYERAVRATCDPCEGAAELGEVVQ